MRGCELSIVLMAIGLIAFGCKPKASVDSDEKATMRGELGQVQRCGWILPSVEKVATQNLKQMVSYAQKPGKNAAALAVAQRTVAMLENMTRSPTAPIHPVAFFAAVKDFESAGELSWGVAGSNGLRYFKTRSCASGECFGLFQVDVNIERDWRGGQLCKADGLNIWNVQGGPDFCASQFWWTVAEGGNKCARISPDGRTNPCRTPNATWTLENVRRGVDAYVQTPQWGRNSWAEMYKNYESCFTNRNPFDRAGALREAISKFRKDIGLDKTVTVPPPDYGVFSFPNPLSELWNKSSDAYGSSAPYGSKVPDFSGGLQSQQ
jgi:hypothetical protein